MNLELRPVEGLPELSRGDVIANLLVAAEPDLRDGDVVVVSQTMVSTVEGRTVPVDPEDPRADAAIVEQESVRVVRRRGDLVIAETAQGFVCASAGVDLSNVARGWAVLLPVDADRSARRIRDGLRAASGASVGVIVSASFGRPWRSGRVGVAIGCAGIAAVIEPARVCVADELASAAELVMSAARGIPAAIVRGVDPAWLREGSIRDEVVRTPTDDLFR